MSISVKNINYKIIKNDNDLYQIFINDQFIRTPMQNAINLPSHKMAKLMSKVLKKNSYRNIIDEVKMTYTAIDKINLNKNKYIEDALLSINTDTILFISKNQKELLSKQKRHWVPLVEWINNKFDLGLQITSNLDIKFLSKTKSNKLKNFIKRFNIYELSALISLISITNSLIISIALLESKINYSKAFKLSFLEELFQASIWGKDEEAYERLNSIKLDIKCVKYYFDSIKN